MAEIKVLENIHVQLNENASSYFSLWNQADKVFFYVTATDDSTRESFLKSERTQFFDKLRATPSYEIDIFVESTVALLKEYWVESAEFIKKYPGGYDVYSPAKSMAQAYRDESFAYICHLYYHLLIRPDIKSIDLFKEIPGLSHKDIRAYIINNGLLTESKFNELDHSPQQNQTSTQAQGTKGKTYEANERFYSNDAELILCKLKNNKFIKVEGDHYRWAKKDNNQLGYLCYKMSAYLLGDNCQIESGIFCQRVQSNLDPKTIGRYARAYRKGTKKLEDAKRKEIDNFFE